jgi:hypothetical protein
LGGDPCLGKISTNFGVGERFNFKEGIFLLYVERWGNLYR